MCAQRGAHEPADCAHMLIIYRQSIFTIYIHTITIVYVVVFAIYRCIDIYACGRVGYIPTYPYAYNRYYARYPHTLAHIVLLAITVI